MHGPRESRGFWNKEGVECMLVKQLPQRENRGAIGVVALPTCSSYKCSCHMLCPFAQAKVTIICPLLGNLLKHSI